MSEEVKNNYPKYFESINDCERFLKALLYDVSELVLCGDKEASAWRQTVLAVTDDILKTIENLDREKDMEILENGLTYLRLLFDYRYAGQRLFRLDDKTEIRDQIGRILIFFGL